MKKVILVVAALVLVISGVAAVSAYEAHLINVKAHVENAMDVRATHVNFGTVFPEEWLIKEFTLGTSSSFCSENQTRVTYIEYEIWAEWKSSDNRTFAWWDNSTEQWVADTGFYNWMGYFTYVGVDAITDPEKKPVGVGIGELVLVGDPPAGAPGTAAKWVLDAPKPLHKKDPYNLNDLITVAVDVPVFEGYYNPDTDPEPKPSGWNDPTWIVPDGSMDYTNLPAHPYYDPQGMDFGLDLKFQVVDIY